MEKTSYCLFFKETPFKKTNPLKYKWKNAVIFKISKLLCHLFVDLWSTPCGWHKRAVTKMTIGFGGNFILLILKETFLIYDPCLMHKFPRYLQSDPNQLNSFLTDKFFLSFLCLSNRHIMLLCLNILFKCLHGNLFTRYFKYHLKHRKSLAKKAAFHHEEFLRQMVK